MPFLLALLIAAGLAWVLYRLQRNGARLANLDLRRWWRGPHWRRQAGDRPAHGLQDPVDAAALLVMAIARLEGPLNREQKAQLIELFTREFQIKRKAAQALYGASEFLLGSVISITPEVKRVLAPSRHRYTPERTASLLRMMRQAATAEGPATPAQLALLDAVTHELAGS